MGNINDDFASRSSAKSSSRIGPTSPKNWVISSQQAHLFASYNKCKHFWTFNIKFCLQEIQRIANILPINLLRTVTEDIKIDGYHFKEGSMVLPQISILMNDPTYFPGNKFFKTYHNLLL